ncbi:zwei Ig domain protein zig-8-like isoform X2 [Tachypleus tridentatus]|uniref:zwei Ig domain protein zig-8-like isoform X2 n=1 Tax=Tachypleus tridentatus TaxID=6853 RepID=UPI003FD152E1
MIAFIVFVLLLCCLTHVCAYVRFLSIWKPLVTVLTWNVALSSQTGVSLLPPSYNTNIEHQPHFSNDSPTNVTVTVGQTAHLRCKVADLGDKMVSWVRLHDLHLLTTGQYTYSNDQRLSVIYKPMSWDWTLQIQFVHQRDKGDYECQINTDPSIGRMVHLNVIAPVQKYKRKSYDWETPMKDATVSEFKGPSIHIQAGESITITCFMDGGSPGQWYHGGSLVNERAVITYSKSQNGNILSKLHIARASSEDSGSYSCGSRSPKTARVTVYVVNTSTTVMMTRKTWFVWNCTLVVILTFAVNSNFGK